MRAIGLDPSLSGFGWAVLNGSELERCGIWSTAKQPGKVTESNTHRFGWIAVQVIELVKFEIGESIGLELPLVYVEGLGVFGDRYTTAIGQGRLLGIVDGVARALGVGVVEVPAADVKRQVQIGGERRKVGKEEIRDAMFSFYPNARHLVGAAVIGRSPKAASDAALNVTDAIAIARAGSQRSAFADALRPGSAW